MKLDGLAADTVMGGVGLMGGYMADPWTGRIMALVNLLYIAFRIYKYYKSNGENESEQPKRPE